MKIILIRFKITKKNLKVDLLSSNGIFLGLPRLLFTGSAGTTGGVGTTFLDDGIGDPAAERSIGVSISANVI